MRLFILVRLDVDAIAVFAPDEGAALMRSVVHGFGWGDRPQRFGHRRSCKSRLLTISDSFYGMVRVPYLQVVWSDSGGRFPWERGFQRGLERRQPMLWLPRDDNPPSPWTRLEQPR